MKLFAIILLLLSAPRALAEPPAGLPPKIWVTCTGWTGDACMYWSDYHTAYRLDVPSPRLFTVTTTGTPPQAIISSSDGTTGNWTWGVIGHALAKPDGSFAIEPIRAQFCTWNPVNSIALETLAWGVATAIVFWIFCALLRSFWSPFNRIVDL